MWGHDFRGTVSKFTRGYTVQYHKYYPHWNWLFDYALGRYRTNTLVWFWLPIWSMTSWDDCDWFVMVRMNSVLIWPESDLPKGSDLRYLYLPFFFFGQKSGRKQYSHDDRNMCPQGLIERNFWVRSCDLQLPRCITNRRRWFESLIICLMQFGLGMYLTSFGNEMPSVS
jgi:hypothetical protein